MTLEPIRENDFGFGTVDDRDRIKIVRDHLWRYQVPESPEYVDPYQIILVPSEGRPYAGQEIVKATFGWQGLILVMNFPYLDCGMPEHHTPDNPMLERVTIMIDPFNGVYTHIFDVREVAKCMVAQDFVFPGHTPESKAIATILSQFRLLFGFGTVREGVDWDLLAFLHKQGEVIIRPYQLP